MLLPNGLQNHLGAMSQWRCRRSRVAVAGCKWTITKTAERCVLSQRFISSINYNGVYFLVVNALSISWPRSWRKVLWFSKNIVFKSNEAFLRILLMSISFSVFLKLLNTSRKFFLVLTSRPISLRIYKNNIIIVQLIDYEKSETWSRDTAMDLLCKISFDTNV